MSIVIYVWVAITLASCLFSFFLGRLPVADGCPRRPWVVHRSYVPDPDRDSKAAVRQFRPPPDISPASRARG
jgi:hypothetical protein